MSQSDTPTPSPASSAEPMRESKCFKCGKPVLIGKLGMLMRPDGSRPHDCGENWMIEHGYEGPASSARSEPTLAKLESRADLHQTETRLEKEGLAPAMGSAGSERTARRWAYERAASNNGPVYIMCPSEDGDWVSWSDYARLTVSLADAQETIERRTETSQEHIRLLNEAEADRNAATRALADAQGERDKARDNAQIARDALSKVQSAHLANAEALRAALSEKDAEIARLREGMKAIRNDTVSQLTAMQIDELLAAASPTGPEREPR